MFQMTKALPFDDDFTLLGPVESNDDTVPFVLQLAALPAFIQSALGSEVFHPDGAQTRLLVTHCSRVLPLTQIPRVTHMELIFTSCSKSLSFGFQKYPHSQVLQLMMMSAELNLIICTDCSLRFHHILMGCFLFFFSSVDVCKPSHCCILLYLGREPRKHSGFYKSSKMFKMERCSRLHQRQKETDGFRMARICPQMISVYRA